MTNALVAALMMLLDDGAMAAMVVDLQQLNTTELVALADSHSPELTLVTSGISDLKELGVTQVIATFSLNDLTRPMPYLAFPMNSPEAAQKLAAELKSRFPIFGLFPSVTVLGPIVVAGNADLPARLGPDRIPKREHLSAALAAAGTGPIRLVVEPTSDQRRVLREMAPRDTDLLGGLSADQLADGIVWASAAISLKDRVVRGFIQSADEDTAESLSAALPDLLRRVIPQVLYGGVEQGLLSLQAMKISVNGSRIQVEIPFAESSARPDPLSGVIQQFTTGGGEAQLKNSLKQLGLAMHNFANERGSFPPPASFDSQGKPLLSWRVYLLPYLDQQKLFEEFHLDEPWDSPHNSKLIPLMPDIFASGHLGMTAAGKTTLVLPVDEKTPFHGKTGTAFREIIDGLSNTVMILDAPPAEAVIWTQPVDMPIDWKNLSSQVFGGRSEAWATICDGSAQAIPATIDPEQLRRLLMHRDGQVVERF